MVPQRPSDAQSPGSDDVHMVFDSEHARDLQSTRRNDGSEQQSRLLRSN